MLKVSMLIKDIDSPMGKYLICRRGPEDKWALPGGEARTNETPQNAAVRLAWEQLNMAVSVGKLQMHARRKLPDHFVTWDYYDAVNIWKTEPAPGAYAEFKWVRPAELGDYGFEDFDSRFLSRFIPWITADGTEIPGTRMF